MLDDSYSRVSALLAKSFPPELVVSDPEKVADWDSGYGIYARTPRFVVVLENEDQVRSLLSVADRAGVSVTFRAAGTSLCGQTVSDSILAALGDGWNKCQVERDGERIRLQPGVFGAEANRALAPYGRKIGPDPASLDIAKIGGIVANNASGMCCGTAENSYRTLAAIRVILADGAIIDTGDAESVRAFSKSHGAMLDQLDRLARRTKADPVLSERIRRKYQIKNTVGYSLNALVDFDDPIDILAHLMIGSEGTLGFISEITLRSVPHHAHQAVAFLLFPDVVAACKVVTALRLGAPVTAVEVMNQTAIGMRVAQGDTPAYVRGLHEAATTLLVETRAADANALVAQVAAVEAALEDFSPRYLVPFTSDPAQTEELWAIRKGRRSFISGAGRSHGPIILGEDVAFPIEHLAEATADLQKLLHDHGYPPAAILGHALEGNLHFSFALDFSKTDEVERFRRLTDGLVELVVDRYDGSLKAEHGTGRAMAPFVEREWGSKALELMRDIKQLFDPRGLLNPGVVLSGDPDAHLRFR
ncbi:FAD/FMN-containing dehydrogenase [Rhodoblastus sphagnicola]|nr:FAD-binding oxidoreductase [Rhodoblastus sphagnicola]MBB4200934.1 FAD/FMN-containing dehydrogenase [Rhodoblastus sphagnicola]